MPLTLERSAQHCTLHFTGDIDITLAAELKDLLLQALAPEAPTHLLLDLSHASTLHITAVQLLLAAQSRAADFNRSVSLCSSLPSSIAAALSLAALQLPGAPA